MAMATAEELVESEVVFGEELTNSQILSKSREDYFIRNNLKRKKQHQEQQKKVKSKPVSIPENALQRSRRLGGEEVVEGGDGEMVPPHVITGRRVEGFSVCTGNGRTLKGRDLCQVRNSVLRMTGFIET